jgi:hypothetical protein
LLVTHYLYLFEKFSKLESAKNQFCLGETWQSKVKRVRGALRAMGADAQVVTALDEIAWLLNIRGRDAMYIPVVRAYVILSMDKITMYVPGGRVPEPVTNHLRTNNCFSDYCVRYKQLLILLLFVMLMSKN